MLIEVRGNYFCLGLMKCTAGPQEVFLMLIPLLERWQLFLPSRGEMLNAAAGFQLFATRTLSRNRREQNGRVAPCQYYLSSFTRRQPTCYRICRRTWRCRLYHPQELTAILHDTFPSLAPLVSQFVGMGQCSHAILTGCQTYSRFYAMYRKHNYSRHKIVSSHRAISLSGASRLRLGP